MKNLFETGCLVKLETSAWTARVKLATKTLLNGEHADVDPRFVAASKRLIDGKALAEVESIRSEARAWLYSQSLPFPLDGAVFVPTSEIERIDRELVKYQARYVEAVEAFCADYPTLREAARVQLGTLYSASDYPVNVRDRFAFGWQFITLAPPSEAQLVSPKLVAQEREKFQSLMANAAQGAVAELRTRFAACVDHVVERLTGEREDGKPKVFKDTLIVNVRDFLDGFEALNVCDDRQLRELVESTRTHLDGVEPGDLRKSESLRAHVAKQMGNVQTALDGMIVDRPTRKLRIEPAKPAAQA